MGLKEKLQFILDDEVEDADEETFLLYSQPLPSQDLGFIDPKARCLEIAIGNRTFTIHQSPTVLSSTRAGGTTGAVVWKVTPIFASWLSQPANPLLEFLRRRPSVVELGCGISPLCALALRPFVSTYLLTDQPYVQRLVTQNLAENPPPSAGRRGRRGRADDPSHHGEVLFRTLDWETDEVRSVFVDRAMRSGFDAIISCDCVFNYALVAPFVQTCADLCLLRARDADADGDAEDEGQVDDDDDGDDEGRVKRRRRPCLCIVAQQLRSDDVFLTWLRAFQERFHVWRVPDRLLFDGLQSRAGFVVHVGILRDPS
ncbi:hypothetical protein RJ55_08060 [Drechmeria coniospora]|nr:hypothetical protein RJ55_08060 [Drechmeria coniospora]